MCHTASLELLKSKLRRPPEVLNIRLHRSNMSQVKPSKLLPTLMISSGRHRLDFGSRKPLIYTWHANCPQITWQTQGSTDAQCSTSFQMLQRMPYGLLPKAASAAHKQAPLHLLCCHIVHYSPTFGGCAFSGMLLAA